MTTQQGIEQGFAIVEVVHWSHNGKVTACGKHVGGKYDADVEKLTATSDYEGVKCGPCLAAPTTSCSACRGFKRVVVRAPEDQPTATGYTEVDCTACQGTGQIPWLHVETAIGHIGVRGGLDNQVLMGTVCGLSSDGEQVYVVVDNQFDATCPACTSATEVGRVGATIGTLMHTPTGHQHLHLLYHKGRWSWVVRESSRLCKTTRCRKVTVTE